MTENKQIIYSIICGITTCIMYYSIGYLVYKFTSLEFIQSESCQHLMLLVFFIIFAVNIKIFGIIGEKQ